MAVSGFTSFVLNFVKKIVILYFIFLPHKQYSRDVNYISVEIKGNGEREMYISIFHPSN